MFTQDARVGVKWNRTLGCFLSQRSFFLCVLRLPRMRRGASPDAGMNNRAGRTAPIVDRNLPCVFLLARN